MNKYNYHTEPIGIETCVTINYDMRELMQGIAQELSTISWAVMGKEVQGAVFVSIDPNDAEKLLTHGSMTKADYAGEALGPENYLWVVIDQIDEAYRARFLTPESVDNIKKTDFTAPEESPVARQMMEMAQHVVGLVARKNFYRGFAWGLLGSVLIMVVIVLALSAVL